MRAATVPLPPMASSSKAVTASGGGLATSSYVSGSMAPVPALSPIAHSHTSVPDVGLQSILQSPTRRTDLLPIITPLRWERWKELLEAAGCITEFADVPIGIRDGFRLGVSSSISSTFSPKNHKSATENPDIIDAYIEKELAAGRYSHGYSPAEFEALFGPYRTGPLGVSFDQPTKPRLVQDHSFPRNNPSISSITSEIDSSAFKCDWGSFVECFTRVLNAPRGTQVAVFDVDAAHRCMPVAPEDRLHVCISWKGRVHLDHCCCFGCTSSSGIFGRCADAMVCIYKAFKVDDVLNWADDFTFWRFPQSPEPDPDGRWSYSYDESLLWRIANYLGWPWSPKKCADFAFHFKYHGFEWDLIEKTVSLPDSKRLKFLAKISAWVAGHSVTRRECESVVGSLNHCSIVIVASRTHLPSLSRFAARFPPLENSSFVRLGIPGDVLADVAWWRTTLSATRITMPVIAAPPLSDIHIFVDASSSWGIGFVMNGRWLAWPFKAGAINLPEGRTIGWAEFVAVELALLALIHSGARNVTFTLYSDNMGVVDAFKAGRSRSALQNATLRRILLLFHEFNVSFVTTWVPSDKNLADGPSRGLFPPSKAIFSFPPKIPSHLRSFIAPAVSPS
jgi:hypothetical protein